MTETGMQAWSSILPITSDGTWVLQHRDDVPDIVDPGKVSFFGGHVEQDETPLECILRESREELGLELRPDDVEFVGVFAIEHDGIARGHIHFYVVRGVDPGDLVLGEGQAFAFVEPGVNLADAKFSGVCREILNAFRAAPENHGLPAGFPPR